MPPPENKIGSRSSPIADWAKSRHLPPQGEPITPDLAANQVVRGATENFRQVCKGALDSTMPFQAGYWYQGPRESFQIIIKESTRENQKWEAE